MKNFICLIVTLFCFSCKKDKTVPVDIREQYKVHIRSGYPEITVLTVLLVILLTHVALKLIIQRRIALDMPMMQPFKKC
jgi:hypothetical protein